MIRHIVMFKFKESAGGRTKAENVRMTKEMLEKLPAKIPQIKRSSVTVNTEGSNPENCDLLLMSDFETLEDLSEYIVHPDHKAVGNFMKPLREYRAAVDISME